jgi:hypothetical protein
MTVLLVFRDPAYQSTAGLPKKIVELKQKDGG